MGPTLSGESPSLRPPTTKEKRASQMGPPTKMSETDKGIMRFVQKNQHCYCAPASELSFFDLVDTFNAGSLEGGDKMALGGE